MAELGNPKNTIEVLQKYQFHFAKKFGQNFLIDTHVLDKIVRAAEITPEDYVLEIGPGIGTLTQYLCESAKHVFAVEIDDNLIPILQDTLSAYDNVTVIHNDVLKLDINKLVEEKCEGKRIKVVANLPYYITTPILMGLFESHAYGECDCYGTKGGRTAYAGTSWRKGLWCIVSCCTVLCRTIYRGKCSAKLFYAKTKCRKRCYPSDKS